MKTTTANILSKISLYSLLFSAVSDILVIAILFPSSENIYKKSKNAVPDRCVLHLSCSAFFNT